MKMIDYNLLKGKITAMQSTEPEYAFNFLNNAQNPSTEWECIEDMLDSMEVYEAEPVNQWISCKDKMPDTLERGLSTMYSDCCLVCDAFGWVGMAYYITDGQKSWWEFADAQNKNKIDWTEVTHWQPLPEPPKDGDTND